MHTAIIRPAYAGTADHINVSINLPAIFARFPVLGFGMGYSIVQYESQRRQHKHKGSCSQLEKNSPIVA